MDKIRCGCKGCATAREEGRQDLSRGIREWATMLKEAKPQQGFMDMNGAGDYLLYLLGDIEKPNEVTPELEITARKNLWKILDGEQ